MITQKVYSKAILKGLLPLDNLTVSEWADKYRVLTTKNAAEPGPYRTDRTPFLKEIMDDLSNDSFVKKVILKKASQIGATEA